MSAQKTSFEKGWTCVQNESYASGGAADPRPGWSAGLKSKQCEDTLGSKPSIDPWRLAWKRRKILASAVLGIPRGSRSRLHRLQYRSAALLSRRSSKATRVSSIRHDRSHPRGEILPLQFSSVRDASVPACSSLPARFGERSTDKLEYTGPSF
jgi:hypothetical protein